MNILALEASTSSVKAMLYDTATETYSIKTNTYSPDYPEMGINQADYVFALLLKTANEVKGHNKIDFISLCTTWHSLLICDRNFRPETEILLWNSSYSKELCESLKNDTDFKNSFYSRTGCMVHSSYPYFKLRQLKNEGKLQKSSLTMNLGTYITWKFSGEYVSSLSSSSGSGLINFQKKDYDSGILNELGIDRASLPQICERSRIVYTSAEVSEKLGIEKHTPLLISNPDGGLNQVGSGALREGIATLSMGTSGAIRLSVKNPVLKESKGLWTYYSPVMPLLGAATSGCCNCLTWIKNRYFENESYDSIDRINEAQDCSALFLPFIFGERSPGWNSIPGGGFFSLESSHTRYSLYRAVQEGVLFNLYQCFEIMKNSYSKPEKLLLSGGVLNSRLWTQTAADIFGEKMYISDTYEASLMGGVVLAKEALELISDITAYEAKITAIIEPDPLRHEKYMRQYDRYLSVYNNRKD